MKTVKVQIFKDSTMEDIDSIIDTLSAMYGKEVHHGGILLDVEIIERNGEPDGCKGYVKMSS